MVNATAKQQSNWRTYPDIAALAACEIYDVVEQLIQKSSYLRITSNTTEYTQLNLWFTFCMSAQMAVSN